MNPQTFRDRLTMYHSDILYEGKYINVQTLNDLLGQTCKTQSIENVRTGGLSYKVQVTLRSGTPCLDIFQAPSSFQRLSLAFCSLCKWLLSIWIVFPFLSHWFFCSAVQCQSLEAPPHGTMACMHPIAAFAYDSSCKFECQPGYRARGSNTLHCTGSGQWSEPLPTCEGKITFHSFQYHPEGVLPWQNDQGLLMSRPPSLGLYLFNLWRS